MRFQLCSLLLLTLLAASLAAPVTAQQLNPEQSQRLYALEHQFMSPCCYGEALYGHMSPAAQEMKTELVTMVSSGKTDREIIEYFKSKFGERILSEPEGAKWWVMNVVPFVLLGLGLVVVLFVIRRWQRPATPSPA
jgi:cytochrome c-type biogenesis protein CcmH